MMGYLNENEADNGEFGPRYQPGDSEWWAHSTTHRVCFTTAKSENEIRAFQKRVEKRRAKKKRKR